MKAAVQDNLVLLLQKITPHPCSNLQKSIGFLEIIPFTIRKTNPYLMIPYNKVRINERKQVAHFANGQPV
ncbi:hypothetical protein [Paenibacillus baekrokdamisoli]|uniref:hypothetical protein n=1 Tax=Paenibacillus baekrokdamisoli TaxID=1712516 RepID=UPI000F79B463|nr:hypothetical protein [Paenibacillus baekrokdamisoli]